MFKNKLILVIYIGVFSLLLFQVYLASGRATDGDRLAEIDSRLNVLDIENDKLQTQVYKLTSIANIEKFAISDQMVPAKVTYLGSVTVASLIAKP